MNDKSIRKLYIVTIRGVEKKVEEVSFTDFLNDDTVSRINNFAKDIGIKIHIEAITHPERFVLYYFEKLGYTVHSSRRVPITVGFLLKDIQNLVNQDKLPKGLIESMTESGSPDFFCFKNENDWFFVEVKSGSDGLRINQIIWMVSHQYPLKIVYTQTSD